MWWNRITRWTKKFFLKCIWTNDTSWRNSEPTNIWIKKIIPVWIRNIKIKTVALNLIIIINTKLITGLEFYDIITKFFYHYSLHLQLFFMVCTNSKRHKNCSQLIWSQKEIHKKYWDLLFHTSNERFRVYNEIFLFLV